MARPSGEQCKSMNKWRNIMKSSLFSGLALAAAVVLAGCAATPRPADSPTELVAADTAQAQGRRVAIDDAVDPNAVRCINEKTTGSRLTQRVCRTEAEWARIREEAQNYTRDMQGPKVAEPIP